MRRTIFLALLAALLLVPAAAAHAADPIKIIRDCEDDGALQGDYTPSELRKARSDLPTDIDEYSDCRDVLSRAIASQSAAKSDGGSSGGSDTAGGDGHDSGSSGTSTPESTSTSTPEPKRDPNAVLSPSSPQDNAALADAATNGAADVQLGQGEARAVPVKLSATVGRNDVPLTLIVLLGLFALAAVTVFGPAARRFVRARRKP